MLERRHPRDDPGSAGLRAGRPAQLGGLDQGRLHRADLLNNRRHPAPGRRDAAQ